tara:strand:+ start:897 stop:1148 length:252 start_codon:yes stop_codon:yes gene_type:complete
LEVIDQFRQIYLRNRRITEMNWLMEMFSEFSDKVMGENEPFEERRKSHRQEGRKFARPPEPPPHHAKKNKKQRAADRFADFDW